MSDFASGQEIDVFISYSRNNRDSKAADLLCSEFQKRELTYYLDRESKPNDEWVKTIPEKIRKTRFMVLIYSTDAENSFWIPLELDEAAAMRVRHWGWFLMEPVKEPSELAIYVRRRNYFEGFHGELEDKIRDFAELVETTLRGKLDAVPPTGYLLPEKSPYLYLQSYDSPEAGTLYGRTSEIDNLARSIRDSIHVTNKRLHFVYGPSGAGKTSLISAGVLPALENDFKTFPPFRLSELNQASAEISRQQDNDPKVLGDIAKKIGVDEDVLVNHARNADRETGIFGILAKLADGRPFVIVIDQFEEWWGEVKEGRSLSIPDDEMEAEERPDETAGRENEIWQALNRFKHLAILLCFREDFLAQVQRLCGAIDHYWNHLIIRGLQIEDAKECIKGPAHEIGIEYEERLVDALVDSLADEEGQIGPQGKRKKFVKPIELQIVFGTLWRNLPRGVPAVNYTHLDGVCKRAGVAVGNARHVRELAGLYVNHVTHGFLSREVREVDPEFATTKEYGFPKARDYSYDKSERIYFALSQFVNEARKRVSLPISGDLEWQLVGRIPLPVIQELEAKKLLRAAIMGGEIRYELIHDRLVEPISKEKEHLELLYAVNALDSAMKAAENAMPDRNRSKASPSRKERTPNSSFQGIFGNDEALVSRLNDFKEFKGLTRKEAEFVFRFTLAGRKDKYEDLKAWASRLAQWHPSTFLEVLHDAFRSDSDSEQVKINAATLIREEYLDKLPEFIKELNHSCRLTKRDNELEEMCYTLASCPEKFDCRHMESLISQDRGLKRIGPNVLLWMRDKVDMTEPGCFVRSWKRMPIGSRFVLTVRLFWLRFRHAGARIAGVVFVSAVITGAGAAVMDLCWSVRGRTFTMAHTQLGFGQGAFHGSLGGVIWGSSLSFSTLIYWQVLRGRRLKSRLDILGGMGLSTLAGFLGGVLLSVLILLADSLSSLKSMGWLSLDANSSDRFDAFWQSGAGWVLPIYGLFLGFGMGWSMLSFHRDHAFWIDVKQQMKRGKDDEGPTDNRKGQNTPDLEPQDQSSTDSVEPAQSQIPFKLRFLGIAFIKSIPPLIALSLAATLIFFLFGGKNLDCAPHQWSRPSRCINRPEIQIAPGDQAANYPISPLGWRSIGMAAVIYMGAYSLLVGYHIALITIRFGIEVPEDKSFAPQSDDQKSARKVTKSPSSPLSDPETLRTALG